MNDELHQRQTRICAKYGADTVAYLNGAKIGVARNVRDGVLPINGVRVTPLGDSSGWFVWAGEWSDAPDFFVPLHVDHLKEWCPSAVPFLLLPPGWRFQVAPNHEDVWFDSDVQTDATVPSG